MGLLQEAMARYTDEDYLMGDAAQLPPVNEKFRPSPKSATVTLTQIVRYVAENQLVN